MLHSGRAPASCTLILYVWSLLGAGLSCLLLSLLPSSEVCHQRGLRMRCNTVFFPERCLACGKPNLFGTKTLPVLFKCSNGTQFQEHSSILFWIKFVFQLSPKFVFPKLSALSGQKTFEGVFVGSTICNKRL